MARTALDGEIFELASGAGRKALAAWAADCAERALPFFERRSPDDCRPREAIAGIREWVRTGVFHMADVRGKSLAAHAAARSVDGAARSAARATRRWTSRSPR